MMVKICIALQSLWNVRFWQTEPTSQGCAILCCFLMVSLGNLVSPFEGEDGEQEVMSSEQLSDVAMLASSLLAAQAVTVGLHFRPP